MNDDAERKVPEQMKAAVIDRFGRPEEVMHVTAIPVPDVGDDEVLIRVAAAGVGPWDPELCEGLFGDERGPFPRVLGSDGAGIVAAVGARARRVKVSDRVYAWGFLNPKGGLFAEYAAIPEEEVSLIPEGLTFAEAGALAVDGLTALAGLDAIQIAAGQKLMIAYPHGVEPAPEAISGVTVSAFDGYSGHEALDQLDGLIAMAPFHVEVSREYPLDAATDAMRDVTRHHVGKLALAVGPR